MSLTMSGLDCHRTPLALREQLAFSGEGLRRALDHLRDQPGVTGCVLLSTCNRTELYLTGDSETPWRLLCRVAGVSEEQLRPYFETRTGLDAARHLTEVACGLHSQILGEDQIITQVRTALDAALEARTADPVLAALFRHAVTAGKRAKTQVSVTRDAPSLGGQCRDVLRRELGTLTGKHVLVIGNGQMGRLAAETLRAAGAQVSVTLRTYRHGETVVPAGCGTVPYEDRIAALEGMDAVISATTSPHYTLTRQQLETVVRRPKIAVDSGRAPGHRTRLRRPPDLLRHRRPGRGGARQPRGEIRPGENRLGGAGAVSPVAPAADGGRAAAALSHLPGPDRQEGGAGGRRGHRGPAHRRAAAIRLRDHGHRPDPLLPGRRPQLAGPALL